MARPGNGLLSRLSEAVRRIQRLDDHEIDALPFAQRWILSPLLQGAALLRSAALDGRRMLAESGVVPQAALARPVIYVRSLTPRGAGKAPFVEFLARHYARTPGLAVLVLPDSSSPGSARMLADVLDGLPVAVAGVEGRGGCVPRAREHLRAHPETRLVLVDGSRSVPRVRVDLDVLMLNALRPLGNGHMSPRGPLSAAPAPALRSADVIVLHHADLAGADAVAAAHSRLAAVAPRHALFFHTRMAPLSLRTIPFGDGADVAGAAGVTAGGTAGWEGSEAAAAAGLDGGQRTGGDAARSSSSPVSGTPPAFAPYGSAATSQPYAYGSAAASVAEASWRATPQTPPPAAPRVSHSSSFGPAEPWWGSSVAGGGADGAGNGHDSAAAAAAAASPHAASTHAPLSRLRGAHVVCLIGVAEPETVVRHVLALGAASVAVHGQATSRAAFERQLGSGEALIAARRVAALSATPSVSHACLLVTETDYARNGFVLRQAVERAAREEAAPAGACAIVLPPGWSPKRHRPRRGDGDGAGVDGAGSPSPPASPATPPPSAPVTPLPNGPVATPRASPGGSSAPALRTVAAPRGAESPSLSAHHEAGNATSSSGWREFADFGEDDGESGDETDGARGRAGERDAASPDRDPPVAGPSLTGAAARAFAEAAAAWRGATGWHGSAGVVAGRNPHPDAAFASSSPLATAHLETTPYDARPLPAWEPSAWAPRARAAREGEANAGRAPSPAEPRYGPAATPPEGPSGPASPSPALEPTPPGDAPPGAPPGGVPEPAWGAYVLQSGLEIVEADRRFSSSKAVLRAMLRMTNDGFRKRSHQH